MRKHGECMHIHHTRYILVVNNFVNVFETQKQTNYTLLEINKSGII